MMISSNKNRKIIDYNSTSKKKQYIIDNYSNIFSEIETENKENIKLNDGDPPMKLSDFYKKSNQQLESIYSINKKVVLLTRNKYDNNVKREKSPFLITDKVCFRKTFSTNKNEDKFSVDKKNNKKKHLGLCDYYAKSTKKKAKEVKKEMKDETSSTTPRFSDGR